MATFLYEEEEEEEEEEDEEDEDEVAKHVLGLLKCMGAETWRE
jgi:hypothetical protein